MSKDQLAMSDPLASITYLVAGHPGDEQFAPAPNSRPKSRTEPRRWRASTARWLHSLADRLQPSAVVHAPRE